jgi:hypothetical protein
MSNKVGGRWRGQDQQKKEMKKSPVKPKDFWTSLVSRKIKWFPRIWLGSRENVLSSALRGGDSNWILATKPVSASSAASVPDNIPVQRSYWTWKSHARHFRNAMQAALEGERNLYKGKVIFEFASPLQSVQTGLLRSHFLAQRTHPRPLASKRITLGLNFVPRSGPLL